MQDLVAVLSRPGRLLFVAPSVTHLAGYEPAELVGRDLTDFVHVDDIAGLRAGLADLYNRKPGLAVYLRFRRSDSRYLLLEFGARMMISAAESDETNRDLILAHARPYPCRTQESVDSFLELSLDNERLRHRLADVYAELERSEPLPGKADIGNALATIGTRLDPDSGIVPEHVLLPSSSNTYGALGIGVSRDSPPSSGQSQNGGQYRSDSGSSGSHRKRRKENSKDGDDSADSSARKGKKKGSEFVCHDCGTLDSPEWRRGPHGPKTLCNACGLVRLLLFTFLRKPLLLLSLSSFFFSSAGRNGHGR
jgi:PAS domain S-box-containing protein